MSSIARRPARGPQAAARAGRHACAARLDGSSQLYSAVHDARHDARHR